MEGSSPTSAPWGVVDRGASGSASPRGLGSSACAGACADVICEALAPAARPRAKTVVNDAAPAAAAPTATPMEAMPPRCGHRGGPPGCQLLREAQASSRPRGLRDQQLMLLQGPRGALMAEGIALNHGHPKALIMTTLTSRAANIGLRSHVRAELTARSS